MYNLCDRQKHIIGVTKRVGHFGSYFEPESLQLLEVSASLHDIGYLLEPNKPYTHAYVGYVFLRSQGFPEIVADLVLCHSFSKEFLESANYPLELDETLSVLNKYSSNPTHIFHLMLEVLSYCDRITGTHGNLITVAERMKDIDARYGIGSVQSNVNAQIAPYFIAYNKKYQYLFFN